MDKKEEIKINKLKEKMMILMKKTKKMNTSILLTLIAFLSIVFILMGKNFVFASSDNSDYESLKNNDTKITFTGDLSPSRYLKEQSKKYGPDVFYKDVKDIWKDSDISLVNVESSVLKEDPDEKEYKKREKSSAGTGVYLDSNKEDIKAIKESGVNLIGYANNHSMDYGVSGLEETLEIFEEEGVDYIGSGRNLEEAIEPYSEEIDGEKIGIMALADTPIRNGLAKKNRPGVNTTANSYLDREIEKMIRKNDFNILYVHWGTEYALKPDKEIRELGREYIDMGVDLVVGSHPHVLLPVESYNDGLIVYSLGNLVFDQSVGRTTDSAIANLYLGEENYLEFVPIDIIDGIPHKTDKKRTSQNVFNSLTKELDNSQFKIEDNKLMVDFK